MKKCFERTNFPLKQWQPFRKTTRIRVSHICVVKRVSYCSLIIAWRYFMIIFILGLSRIFAWLKHSSSIEPQLLSYIVSNFRLSHLFYLVFDFYIKYCPKLSNSSNEQEQMSLTAFLAHTRALQQYRVTGCRARGALIARPILEPQIDCRAD